MCFLRAKPIGLMPMLDQGEQDDKIIAVHADDPEFSGFNDISEIPRHRLAEIKRLCAPPCSPGSRQSAVLDGLQSCTVRLTVCACT